MVGNFEQEIGQEIERLETRVERLRAIMEDMKNDMPESPEVQNGARNNQPEEEDAPRPQQRGATPAPRRSSRPNEEELATMLVEAPTNKNGSVDLRTDAGRTLRAFGMVDQIGFPTEEAEELLKAHNKSRGRRAKKSSEKAGRR